MSKSTHKKRAARGYTVVEVLIALTLFAIGAAGVIGMQRVTIQGGTDARRFDMATNIAHEWQHRLQRDSMFWTEPNSVTLNINLNQTKWLNNVGSGWVIPSTTGPGFSGAFDLFGRDVPLNDPNAFFCVMYRLDWIAAPNNPPRATAVMRAEIRVFYSRLEKSPANCAAPNPLPDAANAQNFYHQVVVTTAIRGNPNQ